jgi:hypothetical protein
MTARLNVTSGVGVGRLKGKETMRLTKSEQLLVPNLRERVKHRLDYSPEASCRHAPDSKMYGRAASRPRSTSTGSSRG